MDSKTHKNVTGCKAKNSLSQQSVNGKSVKIDQTHKSNKSNLFYTSSGLSDRPGSGRSTAKSVKLDKSDNGDNSYEIWCICRVVKPCRECRAQTERDRDVTPTPQQPSDTNSPTDQDSNCSTPTPDSAEDKDNVSEDSTDDTKPSASQTSDTKCVKESSNKCDSWNKDSGYEKKVNLADQEDVKGDKSSNKYQLSGNDREVKKVLADTNTNIEVDKECGSLHETGVNDLEGLLAKLEELSKTEETCDSGESHGNTNDYKSLDFVPNMDSASVCSFDHFDFDTSFCSLKSTDMMMDQGDLADQLSLVQQMVMEMKTGFSTAMEELSKIQYGDQTLQQQLADNKKECSDEIDSVKQTLIDLKTDIQKLSGQIQEVTEVQRGLQEKVDAYQSDKAILLDELERNGAITDQIRLRLSGTLQENNNNNHTDLTDVAPMVHPYLNSLQNHHQHRDDQYNSDSSLTAAVSRSLNLTQALGEKCLQLDMSSSSSDEEESSRHSHSGTSRKASKRHGSFQQEKGQAGQKVPPHKQVLEEVQREEAARDIVEAEREYCSQIWSLLEDYLNPLRDEDIVNKREINNMFPAYIPHLYEQHCIMLRKMEERVKKWKFTTVVGDLFARFTEPQDGEGLNLYKDYISDFPLVINTMNKWFIHSPHFRELMQSQNLASSPVLSSLLAPLQQVPKYSLLLKNLLKYTPVDHPDRYYLESSLNRLKGFLNTMNSDLEQAMQTINLNSQPITRSRDSARSRSSGSSAENNHLSRDSGVHSNEEERAKSPMSPNTTRRFVLQVLREKREQEARQPRGKIDMRPPSPQGRFGSHPDLTNQYNGLPDGRMSPYQLSSLPQSKMFSSLSKLPLPKEKGKRSKSSRLHEAPRPVINTNYLRPLTPQLFPASSNAYNFEAVRRRDEFSERPRHRPASAMEFTTNTIDSRDQYLEIVANQAGLTLSPSHSTSSDHSRRELELSLQKLLLETNNANGSYTEDTLQEGEVGDEPQDSYQKQFLATKERILKHGQDSSESHHQQSSTRKVKRKLPFQPHTQPQNTQEDYGIYGDDDDDDDDENTEYIEQDKLTPMKLLPDTHRPKIMVPRWRQNASPHPPSYSQSVEQMNKTQTGFTSEENLAASLAQSLLDGEKNQSSAGENLQKAPNQTGHASRAAGSLKRKEASKNTHPARTAQSPRRSPARASPHRDETNSMPHGRSQSFDVSANRPTDLHLTHTNSVCVTSASETAENRDALNSVSKLTDVIAYTADCLEKSESVRITNVTENDNDLSNRSNPSTSQQPTTRSNSQNPRSDPQYHVTASASTVDIDNGHLRLSNILSDNSLKVSSVDDSDTSPVLQTTVQSNQNMQPFSFAVSSNISESKTNPNTESVVQYFKNRDEGKNSLVNSPIKDPNSKIPTFIHMDKTSTPVSEQRPFSPSKNLGKENSSVYQKREIGRAVRDDYGKETKPSGTESSTTSPNSATRTQEGQSVPATKESVLRKVDKLRMSFERQKQLSEERRQQSMLQSPTKELKNPFSQPYIQKQFNEISMANRKSADNTPSPTSNKPLVLKTFSMPNSSSHDRSGDQSDSHDNSLSDSSDHKQGIYRKAAQPRTPLRYPTDTSSGAKHKLERATSPTVRTPSPTNFTNQYDKFRQQVESSNLRSPTGRILSPTRSLKDASLIPQRSKSPTRSSAERERPKSTTDLEKIAAAERDEAEESEHSQLKSALKDSNTKIPVLKKASVSPGISKSTEDISKIKKKSAFKTKLNNIFGRKKKKSKLYSTDYYDAEQEYNNYVTEVPSEPSFLLADDTFNFPLTSDRRSNSTSQILQSYYFESESDSMEEISAV